jgi:glycerol-3-phosphate dehydrogenase
VRFLKFDRYAWGRRVAKRLPISERGLWTVRIGLWLYDLIARDNSLPRHSTRSVDGAAPRVDPGTYRWLCGYSDAQILYPERFVLALLEDARRAAEAAHVEFRVLTRHRAELDGALVRLLPAGGEPRAAVELRPSTIVNATGAWGDFTLRDLNVPSPQLFGGTKGSHIITRQPALRAALGEDAVYAEAADGRLVFVLPFADSVLVGTTDERFEPPPDRAVATDAEVAYLVEMVNEVFASVRLTVADVDAHYCGVRPLPSVHASRTGAIPRGHWIDTNTRGPVPIDTLIGGKLTTCRAFGELAADRVLQRIGVPRTADTRERTVPGAEEYPRTESELDERWRGIAARTGFALDQIQSVWRLLGTRASDVLQHVRDADRTSLPGTSLPVAFVDWVIAHEWVQHLEDLVERRLMLAWEPHVTRKTLVTLAEQLHGANRISAADMATETDAAAERLAHRYGRRLASAGVNGAATPVENQRPAR